METKLHRNIGMELVRATEASAMMAGQWIGRGNVKKADHAASQAMLDVFDGMQINGKIVFDKPTYEDESNLFAGKSVGTGEGPQVDVLAAPIDGTTQLARGIPGVIAAAAITPRGSIWQPPHIGYMDKIIVDAEVAPYLVEECMDAPPAWTLSLIARAKGVKVSNLSVFVLDRPRHADLIAEIRATGAHVILRADGDVVGALMACMPNRDDIDILMGIGGIQEGLLGACVAKSLGGSMLGRLVPQSTDEIKTINNSGYDPKMIFSADDFIKSEQVFFAATGITNGPIGRGIRYYSEKAMTNSLILRCETRTHRAIQAEHLVEKWIEFNT